MNNTTDPQVRAELIALEERVWAAIGQHDATAFLSLVAEDALIISGGVRRSAATYAALLPIITIARMELTDFQLIPVGTDAYILHYTLGFAGVNNANDLTGQYCVSSVWVRRTGEWRLIFNQDSLSR